MAFVFKVAAWAAKYGSKAVAWVWEHKYDIINWGTAAYNIIDSIFG